MEGTSKRKYDGADRRQRYRLSKDTKILVKAGRRTEVGAIQNMTRTGIYFEAFGEYHRGQMLDVTFPYHPAHLSTGKSQHAEVVRVIESDDSLKKGVAIKLLDMFLKP